MFSDADVAFAGTIYSPLEKCRDSRFQEYSTTCLPLLVSMRKVCKAIVTGFFYFVVLDEVTSALSEEAEEMLYSKLTDLGITFLSIGQRSSLKKVCHHSAWNRVVDYDRFFCSVLQFHHQILTISQDKDWVFSNIAS